MGDVEGTGGATGKEVKKLSFPTRRADNVTGHGGEKSYHLTECQSAFPPVFPADIGLQKEEHSPALF